FAGGRLVCLTASINGGTDPGGLVGDEILAPLHKLFPLRAPAIDGLAAAIDVLVHLFLALVDKSGNLLLAPVYQSADLFRSLAGAGTQKFSSLACASGDVLPGFTSALGSIENTHQGTHSQSGQKPG